MTVSKTEIQARWLEIQDSICRELEAADGSGQRFREDIWQRPEGGGGRSRTFENGAKIEKGGVLFSAVFGELPEAVARLMKVETGEFFATGVSIVIHPQNPWCPIIHLNIRYFEAENEQKWWFGGGIDLTPHFIETDDARLFHAHLKATCDRHDPAFYPKFKAQADDYFYLKHRQETRGVGGIFFDYLDEKTGLDKRQLFDFVADIGAAFAPIYTLLMHRNSGRAFGQRQRNWQGLRRGRYVEFNLVWDKGTKFGLETNGRTESILASLPPLANWIYGHEPEPGSPEFFTQSMLKKGVNWLE